MAELYILNINQDFDESKQQDMINFLPEERKIQIQQYRFLDDIKRGLYAGSLIFYIIHNIFGLHKEEIKFTYNKYGKPYLANIPNFYFNVSHSGEFVICGWSNKEIGVDIERITEVDLTIAENFAELEKLYLCKKALRLQREAFFDLWTLKESYIKYKGKGLSIPLNSFSFDLTGEDLVLNSNDKIKPFFFRYDILGRYKLSICSEDYVKPILRTISPQILWQTLYKKIDINP